MLESKKSQIRELIVGLTILGLVSACSSSSTPSSAAATSAAATSAASAPAASTAATGSLEIFSWWTSGAEDAALNVIISAYKAQYPNVEVVNAAVSGGGGANMQEVLQTRIAGGNPPATWQSHPGDILKTYAASNTTLDLTSLYSQEGWGKVMPPDALGSVTVDGKQFSVYTGVHRHNIVWWNMSVAKQLGVTIGEKVTWAEFTDALAKAKAAGVTGLCNGDQQIFASVSIAENPLLAHLGADGMKKLATTASSWDEPKVSEALNDYSVILDNENADRSALSWDQAVKKMANGECLFNMMADSAYGELLKAGKVDGTDFGYFAFPGTDSVFLNVSDSFVVASTVADPTNALNWAKTIMDPKVQVDFSKQKGSIPVRTDVDVSSLGAYQQWDAACLKSCTVLDSMTFSQSVVPAVNQAFYDAVTSFNQTRGSAAFIATMKAALGN